MDNFPRFTIFKGFSILLGLFTSISSYFDLELALNSKIPLTVVDNVTFYHYMHTSVKLRRWRWIIFPVSRFLKDFQYFWDFLCQFRVILTRK